MMADYALDTVTGSTTPPPAVGGERINNTDTRFYANFALEDFMDQPASNYCYTWESDGRITRQFDWDESAYAGVGACDPASQLFSSP